LGSLDFSLLIAVYSKDRAAYLHVSLESVWDNQTLRPSQIVLVCDGPLTLDLERVLLNWKSRLGDLLTEVRLPENKGLGSALNAGLGYCRHELVARMDADDISCPERFAIQVEFMLFNPSIDVASAYIEEFDDMDSRSFVRRLPIVDRDIKRFAKKRNPISHPVVIYRREALLEVGGYPPLFPEDYALWSLLIVKGYRFANIPKVLLKMRTGRDFIGRRGFDLLRGEIRLLEYQRRIKFITWPEYFLSLGVRLALRLPPASIRRWLYRNFR
jgi:glycosyltransferase involved in cell wall biosynthesis